LLYLWGRTLVPTEEEFGWAPEPVWTLWTREKFSSPPTAKEEVYFQIQIMFMTFHVKGLLSFYCECDRLPTDEHEQKNVTTLRNLRLK
jgi:hypothetical protein